MMNKEGGVGLVAWLQPLLSPCIPYSYDILMNPLSETCSVSKVCDHIKNLKSMRAFSLFLNIDPGWLDEFKRSRSDIVQRWFDLDHEVSDVDRWEELGRILLQPAINEPNIAYGLKPYLKKDSPVYSAITSQASLHIPALDSGELFI
jgi:hypothetical protein